MKITLGDEEMNNLVVLKPDTDFEEFGFKKRYGGYVLNLTQADEEINQAPFVMKGLEILIKPKKRMVYIYSNYEIDLTCDDAKLVAKESRWLSIDEKFYLPAILWILIQKGIIGLSMNWMKEKRLELNLTQAELADMIYVTPQTIGNLERGFPHVSEKIKFEVIQTLRKKENEKNGRNS